ncbi:MAG: cytochrome c oxidase subunit 3 family protein [Panacagrimonas sp.]
MSTISQAAPRTHIPGEPGIWLFVLGDMVIYGIFFLFYAHARSQEPALFAQSQALLNQVFGVANTLILLSSSWFVVKGVQAARRDPLTASPKWFRWAFLCGVAFCLSKAIEYTWKIDAGITLTSNTFFMYWYLLTFFHLVHVLIGMAVLVFMWRATQRPALSLGLLESGATFWHLVDLLWVLIFPLLYLAGAQA